jgi:hypothetical protein
MMIEPGQAKGGAAASRPTSHPPPLLPEVWSIGSRSAGRVGSRRTVRAQTLGSSAGPEPKGISQRCLRALAFASDGRDGNRFISNTPGRGYSFVAPVTREQRQDAGAPSSRPALGGNLPAQLMRVIGRDDFIATAVSRLFQHRLLTIVGPGGIGKTTVALATAEATSASCPDGVWFIGLSTIIDAALVPGAVGATLGMSPSNIDPLLALGAWLRDKHLLIVFDVASMSSARLRL